MKEVERMKPLIVEDTPKVTVLMAVYNGEIYLREAIHSILGQTFQDFEFLVINDGSTDRTQEIIEGFSSADDRIRAIHQEHAGLVPSLNKGSAGGERAVHRSNGC